MPRPKKKTPAERAFIASRYRDYLRNHPQRVCREHGISWTTLIEYAREFGVPVGRPSRDRG